MIEEVVIQNLGVIDSTVLPLGPGFTALTGETGAGKTMAVTALGLLLGERATNTAVREGAASSEISGVWHIAPTSPAAVAIAELDIVLDQLPNGQRELIISRTIGADGRSRAYLAGRPVPVSALGQVAESLVVVHGQSDQLRLKSVAAQREALDSFIGSSHQESVREFGKLFHTVQEKTEQLRALQQQKAAREAEAALLREALDDYEKLQPQQGELDEISARVEKLQHFEDLRRAVGLVQETIQSDQGETDALSLIGEGRKQLEQATKFDAQLSHIVSALIDAEQRLIDVGHDVSSYLANLSDDVTAELEQLESRRAELNQLARRHGGNLDEAIQYAETAGLRLLELDQTGDTIEALSAELITLNDTLNSQAAALTAARVEAAKKLSERVTKELGALAMPNATFIVDVTPATTMTVSGSDQIVFMLSSHPGATPRPVAKSASGGELSRIMLGIEVVLSEVDPVPTMVFDEIDAGVGGAAATEIGQRLALLAQKSQVIVVTHLAQVAAFATNSLKVTKSSDDESTISTIEKLSGETHIAEVARLLSGQPESDLARAHATELIAEAKSRIE